MEREAIRNAVATKLQEWEWIDLVPGRHEDSEDWNRLLDDIADAVLGVDAS